MTKSKEKFVNTRQYRLLDMLKEDQRARQRTAPGRMNIGGKLVAAMRVAIRQAPKSREVIAEEMSELTGCTISVHQVNNWTAESHPHRIPGEWVPAFCEVTQDFGPMRLLAETAGVYTLPGPDALRAEIQKLDEDARNIRNEKRKRELFLREIER